MYKPKFTQVACDRMIRWVPLERHFLTFRKLFRKLQKEKCLSQICVYSCTVPSGWQQSSVVVHIRVPLRWARRGWPGVPGSECSCRCGGRMAGKPGRSWTWSSSPCQWGRAPRWRQGLHWKSCSSAVLADRRNTGRCKQKPSLLWSGCVARSTQTPQEKIKPAGGQRRREHVMRDVWGWLEYQYDSGLFDHSWLQL